MRPGQNKRMRGRNNNNGGSRKGPNPLTRSYESNGPDVKIRGTAQHIGEKYLQLARDAQTSGDPVAAESYLQHAEHYFRIIAAAHQAQQQAQNGFVRQPGDPEPDDGDDDDDLNMPDRFASPAERLPIPPPVVTPTYPERQPYNGERQGGGPERYDRQDRTDGQDRGYRQDRPQYDREGRAERPAQDRSAQDRQSDRQGQDRQQGSDRQAQDRPNYDRQTQERASYDRDRAQPRLDRPDRNDRGNRPNRTPRDGQDQRDNRDPQYREQPRVPAGLREPEMPRQQPTPPPVESEPDLPAFITAPVRVSPPPVAEAPVSASAFGAAEFDAPSAQENETFAVRPRRRRRPRSAVNGDAETGPEGGSSEGSDL